MNPSRSRYLSRFPALSGPLAILLLGLFMLPSCDPPPIELTRADRRQVDSLFQAEKNNIDREVDSLCKLWSRERLQVFKDSLMDRRWAEIRQILQSDE